MRQRRKRAYALRALNDFLSVLAAFAIALLIVGHQTDGADLSMASQALSYAALAAAFGMSVMLIFRRIGLYRPRATVLYLREMQLAATGITLAATVVLSGLFIFEIDVVPRSAMLWGIGLSFVTVITARRLGAAASRALGTSLRNEHRTLIYGCGDTGRLLMKKIAQAPQVGRHVVGFVDDYAAIGSVVTCRISQHDTEEYSASVLGRSHEIARLVTLHAATELLITSSAADSDNLRRVVPLAMDCGLEVGIVPRLGDVRADELKPEDLGALSVLRPYQVSESRWGQAARRVVDVVLASLLLLISLPLWVIFVPLIRLESDGPALFRQERIGKDGRRFVLLKFRTMKVDSPAYASSTEPLDTRVTGIGRFLRMSSLDEIPQLINVVRGEMSLVGPRPEMPFLVQQYSNLHRKRLDVRPGITGVWQLSPDRHGAEIHDNIEYDLFYLRYRSVLLDAVILLETVFFTLSLLPRRSWALLRKRLRPATVNQAPSATQNADVSDEFVLVALDQRSDGSVLDSWSTGLRAARSLATSRMIRVLTAPVNVAMYDALVRTSDSEAEGNGDSMVEYIPYERQAQLKALARSAQVVVTDLPHVARWAREKGIETVDLV